VLPSWSAGLPRGEIEEGNGPETKAATALGVAAGETIISILNEVTCL
jgi:hypothetical protein